LTGEYKLRKFLKDVYKAYRPLQFWMLGLFGFIALAQAMRMVSPWLSSKIIDGLVGNLPTNQIYAYGAISIMIWLFKSTIFDWLRDRYELNHLDYAIPRRIQEVTLAKLFGFSIGQHTSENSGVKQTVINRGENALINLGDIILYQAFPLFAEIVILTGLLLYWSRPIGLVVLTGALVYAFVVVKINNHFRADMKKLEKLHIKDSNFQGEVVKYISLVMANAQEERAQKECKESLGGAHTFSKNVWSRFATVAAIRNTISVIALGIVLVICISAVRDKTYTLGQFVMFMAWAGNALGNLGNLSPLHRRFIQHYTSVRKYFEMLAITPDVTVIPNPVRPEKFAGRIEFKNVTFRYKGREQRSVTDDDDELKPVEPKVANLALDNVSFVIEAGQTVAFVGESGAGKSTLVKAIIRAQDPEIGQIIVDGNDLRLLDLKHFRSSIGIVDQDVALFDQSLRYNMTYGLNGRATEISDRELHRIAEMSCIDRFFGRLEKGFDTHIGERGVKLSGGERQRVGIARALIKEPDILIFDEATSSLDSENESLIQESIERASRGRTTIIIAHRFSTIRNVDKVIVFDKGKIVGQGTHEELATSCEIYQRLTRKQIFV
jgi:ABC-type multidrug transport system fused ATPase/permease subunit